MVGVVQQWWLRREAVQEPRPGADFIDHYRYARVLHELYEEFPRCLDPKAEPQK
jgi:hypothetical protein